MKKKSKSLAHVFPVLLLCLFCLIPPAYADIGPKQEVTITVINAPDGEIYLDLLAEGTPTENPYPSSINDCNPAILANLLSLEGNGWVLSYTTGLEGNAPIFGDIRPQADGTWRFSYYGLRETFRVAVATADAAQAMEAPYTREFFSNIVYDWETNAVHEATPSPLRFLARLASTLVPTLLVEGILFWLFKFREKQSWLVFLAANVVTQVGLHLIFAWHIPIAGTHPLFYAILFVPSELVICAAEALAYAFLLKEHDRHQRVGYAILANIVSAVLGYFPLHLLYDFLTHM